MLSSISITDGTVFTGNEIESLHNYHYYFYYCIGQHGLRERASLFALTNDAYKSVHHTFNFEVLCYYNATIMTVLLHTAMLISSICLGTTLHIESNGLRMNQLFGISRLILKRHFDTWLYRWFVMMLDADTQSSTGDTIMRRYQE